MILAIGMQLATYGAWRHSNF